MEQWERWDSLYSSSERRWRGVTSLENMPFPSGCKLLEVGCGNGKTAQALIDKGYVVTAMDFSQKAVEICSKMLNNKTRCVVGDIRKTSFSDGEFDGVVLFHVMENILDNDLKKVSKELKRITVDGSYVIAKSFTPDDMRSCGCKERTDGNGIEYRYRDAEEYSNMFSDGECVSIHVENKNTRFGTERSIVYAIFKF